MKALITLLIIGTSSVALARPITVYDRDTIDDGVIVRDHRDQPVVAPAPDQFAQPAPDRMYYRGDYEDDARYEGRARLRMRPVMLANDVSFMRQWNRDSRPLMIDVDARIGGIKKLRIERGEGRMYVASIDIMFADGHRQSIAINRTLSAREPSLTINLDHGAVTAVSVNGQTMRGRATFDLIGLRR
jgi:hypothetical protein